MNKKGKRLAKNYNTLKDVIKATIVIVVILAISLGGAYFLNKRTQTQLVDTTITTEDRLLEKDQTINELKNTIEELQIKQDELEKEIENVRISKIQAKRSTTATSRSGTTTRTTVQTTTKSNPNVKWIWVNASGYCPCAKCCGKTNGITAMGTKAQANHTIAAPSSYAFGTQVEIQGYGTYTVEDRGGAIQGNKIDIFFATHQEALNFGKRQLQMRVL